MEPSISHKCLKSCSLLIAVLVVVVWTTPSLTYPLFLRENGLGASKQHRVLKLKSAPNKDDENSTRALAQKIIQKTKKSNRSSYRGGDPLPEVLPPLIGLVTTHHKTGTVLFADMFTALCPTIGVDLMKVFRVVTMGNTTLEYPMKYLHSSNATEMIGLSMHGFKEQCSGEYKCDRFNATCRLPACQSVDHRDQSYEIVHVVRNPLEMLISGFLYHREVGASLVAQGSEMWLMEDKSHLLPEPMAEKFKGVPYYKQVLEELSLIDGIKAEFLVNGAQIFQAARNYRDSKNRAGVVNIHFEDFELDFQGTMTRVFKSLRLTEKAPLQKLLKVASAFDIRSIPKEILAEKVNIHVTKGKFDKSFIRKLIYDDLELREVFEILAVEMGYQSAFPDGIQH
ncbi:hypothetical protein BSKO_13570 [Bryopsis sp. KO-2023]|nr:hypothetical protein BSKO_13570 [Bryopsis sp. KO-2023]